MRSSILPVSIQIVFEDKPLLRITETGPSVTDYYIRPELLVLLAKQALNAYQRSEQSL